MKRAGLLTIVAALVVVAATVAWNGLRQDREFWRLIARGEVALAADQTFLAVEAFSEALALRPYSMLAHLKRGDAYRRGKEFTAALRDLRGAVALDPSATKPRELLGDVSLAMGRDGRAIEHYEAYLALD
jgi:tetratricopeptide (TPR) repeat protein